MADSLPIHVMRGTDWMAQYLKECHPDLRRGDAFLHNSPYHGNTHPGDFGIMVPIVDENGEHQLTAVAKGHLTDVGCSIRASQHPWAKDVYEEGSLIFPAVQVQRDYEDIDDIIRLCRVRIRKPEQWYGDYLALLGSVRVAERRVLELGEEIGWKTLHRYTKQWFDYSEQMMKAAIAKLPAGTTSSITAHDPWAGAPDGVPVQVLVTVKPEEGMVEVDLTHNPDSLPNGLNTSRATATLHPMVAIFKSLPSDLHTNAGSFRRIDVKLRENCCVGIPRHPHSCSLATTNLGNRCGSVTGRALAALGEGIGQGEVGAIEPPAMGIISGIDPRKGGDSYIDHLCLSGGGGAAFGNVDGWLTIGDNGATTVLHMDSIESDEVQYPLYVYERCVHIHSEGPGKFRGAPGTYVEYGPIPDATMQVIYLTDGDTFPALGARGAGHGGRGGQMLRTASGDLVRQGPTGPLDIAPGESIIVFGNGGGGYGRPWERDLERVKKDVLEQWITRERAEAVYGVIFEDDGEVDHEATGALRQRMEAAAGPWQNTPPEILSAEEVLRRVREETKDVPYPVPKERWW
jgi:N-methylhydantoinase B